MEAYGDDECQPNVGDYVQKRKEISIKKYEKEMFKFSFKASVVHLRENAFCIINKILKSFILWPCFS